MKPSSDSNSNFSEQNEIQNSPILEDMGDVDQPVKKEGLIEEKKESLEKMANLTESLLSKFNEIKVNKTKSCINSFSLKMIIMIFFLNSLVCFLEIFEKNMENEIVLYFIKRMSLILSFYLIFIALCNLPKIKNDFNNYSLILNMFLISVNMTTSSTIISYFFKINISFETHSFLFFKDLQWLIVTVSLVCMRYNMKQEILNFTILFLLMVQILNTAIFRIYLDKFFNFHQYLEMFLWLFIGFSVSKIVLWKNDTLINEKVEKIENLENNTKEINKVIKNFKTNLLENYDQIAPITSSKADSLLMKLKYLKFQALINLKDRAEKNSEFLYNGKTINEDPTSQKHKKLQNLPKKRGSHTNLTTDYSPVKLKNKSIQIAKPNSTILDEQKNILLQKIEAYDYALGGEKIKKDKRWTLTPDDVDEIMNGILSKPNVFWLPNFLSEKKEMKSNLGKEAKDFLLNHFTDSTMKVFAEDITKKKMMEYDAKFMDFNPLNKYLINVCENWNYDVFFLDTLTNGNVIIEFGYCIFLKFQINKCLKIENNTILTNFLSNIQGLYRDNPYHNAMHASDVTNSIGFFLVKGLNEIFTHFELSCLVISALAHDLGHPGLNNAFLVATKSKNAIFYNDQSVLENYHASALFQILINEKSDITSNLTEKEFRQFRKLCIGMILDTDLQKHFIIMNKFKNLLALGQFDMKEESNRSLALSSALKCADIGHGAKGLELHKRWSRRIIEEFFNQGDLELKHNMPISPLCDRNSAIPKSQEGFLKCIVLPLYEAWEEFVKIQAIKENCSDQIKKNLIYWQAQIELEENGKKITFMDETQDVFNEITKSTSKSVDDNLSTFSCI